MATCHLIDNLVLLSIVLLVPSKGSAHGLQLGIEGLREIKNGGCLLPCEPQRVTLAMGVVAGDHHMVRGSRRTLEIFQLYSGNNTPETPGETETAWLRGLGVAVDNQPPLL